MADTVGSLKVLLGLDAAEYTRGLTKAEKDAERFAQQVRSSIVAASAALAAGLTVAAIAAVKAAKDIIAEAAALNDLSDATGSSVESLSRLNNQVKISGGDFATMENAILKLSSAMSGTDEGGNRAQKTLQLLGIRAKDPAEALQQLARKLDTYANGINKVGLVAAVFGEKQGPAFLKILQDIAELQDVGATVSKRQAEEAENLEKAFRRLTVEASTFRNVILSDVVPALNEMIKKMRETIDAAGGFWAALRIGAETSPFEKPADGAARLTKRMGELQEAQSKLSEGQRGGILGRGLQKQIDDAQRQLNFFAALVDKEEQKNQAGKATGNKPPPPPPPPKHGGGTDQTAKRLLDQQLKDLENFIRSEQDTLRDREQFLSIYYQDDQIGLRDFFSGRRAALEEAISKESALLDKQAALLKVAAGKRDALQEAKGLGIDPDAIKAASELAAKAETRIDAETKLADVLAKKARLEQDGVTNGIQLFLEEGRAVKQFRESIEQANIALLEMRGDSVAAATASFDFANRRRSTQIKLLSQSPSSTDQAEAAAAAKALSDTRALIEARAQLNKATEDYSLTLGALENAQARINILTSVGAIGEIEGLKRTSELRAKYVEKLREQIEIAERAANAIDAPEARARALAGIDAMKVKLEELAATGDLVAQKFNNLIGESFSEQLQALVKGEKSFKDALKDFGTSVQNKIIKIASDELTSQLFGKGGLFSGAGDILSKIFGGKGAGAADATGAAAATSLATSTTAAATAMTGITTSTTAAVTAMTGVATSATAVATADAAVSTAATLTATALSAVATAAATAAAALATVAASSAASAAGGIFKAASAFQGPQFVTASGTTWAAGGRYLVGELGIPEIVDLPPGARVTPKNMGGNVNNSRTVGDIHLHFPGGTTASPRQIRNAARDGVMTAIRDR